MSLTAKGFLEVSFLDWPGKVVSVIFLGGCNFRCPFCHNPELVLASDSLSSIPLQDITKRITALTGWVDGVVISGGEPTLNQDLPQLAASFRKHGLGIKLDTNGSRPEVLEHLLEEGLVDHIAMDLKAPLTKEAYRPLVGVDPPIEAIARSVDLLKASKVGVTFRTTLIPGVHSLDTVSAIRAQIFPHPLKLQAFNPSLTLDPLWQEMDPFSTELLSSWEHLLNREHPSLMKLKSRL